MVVGAEAVKEGPAFDVANTTSVKAPEEAPGRNAAVRHTVSTPRAIRFNNSILLDGSARFQLWADLYCRALARRCQDLTIGDRGDRRARGECPTNPTNPTRPT